MDWKNQSPNQSMIELQEPLDPNRLLLIDQ